MGDEASKGKQRRGFACMAPEKQRAIAAKGGVAAHAKGTAHRFTSEEARAAGRIGGVTVSRDRARMAEIGRLGGKAAARGRAEAERAEDEERLCTLEEGPAAS